MAFFNSILINKNIQMFNVLSIIKYIMGKKYILLLPKKISKSIKTLAIERRGVLNLKLILYKISQVKCVYYICISFELILS